MKRLSQQIGKIIEDQLAEISIDINGEEYTLADALDEFDGDFDVREVVKKVTNLITADLEARKFTFQQSQFLSKMASSGQKMGLRNHCDKCGRLQGEWVCGGNRISDEKLLRFGMQVILPE